MSDRETIFSTNVIKSCSDESELSDFFLKLNNINIYPNVHKFVTKNTKRILNRYKIIDGIKDPDKLESIVKLFFPSPEHKEIKFIWKNQNKSLEYTNEFNYLIKSIKHKTNKNIYDDVDFLYCELKCSINGSGIIKKIKKIIELSQIYNYFIRCDRDSNKIQKIYINKKRLRKLINLISASKGKIFEDLYFKISKKLEKWIILKNIVRSADFLQQINTVKPLTLIMDKINKKNMDVSISNKDIYDLMKD